jgi:hypothetical protein
MSGLLSVFQPFTPRPAAHLRELAEACTLLTMEPEDAAALAAALSGQAAVAQLKGVSVSRLNPEQALCVLRRRLY